MQLKNLQKTLMLFFDCIQLAQRDITSMLNDSEWNWLFDYYYTDGRLVHPDDQDLDDEYGCEPNEIEVDPQYGSLNRFPY